MKKRVLSFVALLTAVLLISGCNLVKKPNSTGSNVVSNPVVNNAKDLEKNITSEGAVTKRGRLIVIAKNKNKVNVDLTIEVEFYDADGNLAGSGKESLYSVGAGSEVAVELYDTPEEFDNYKIYTDAKVEEYTKSYVNKVEITHNKNENVVAQVKNNSSEVIGTMEVAIVYYKGDKVVGYDYSYQSDIKPDRSGNFNFSNPYDKNYDDVEYDNYKIFVNEAFSYSY